jgi:hypothetical protein
VKLECYSGIKTYANVCHKSGLAMGDPTQQSTGGGEVNNQGFGLWSNRRKDLETVPRCYLKSIG